MTPLLIVPSLFFSSMGAIGRLTFAAVWSVVLLQAIIPTQAKYDDVDCSAIRPAFNTSVSHQPSRFAVAWEVTQIAKEFFTQLTKPVSFFFVKRIEFRC